MLLVHRKPSSARSEKHTNTLRPSHRNVMWSHFCSDSFFSFFFFSLHSVKSRKGNWLFSAFTFCIPLRDLSLYPCVNSRGSSGKKVSLLRHTHSEGKCFFLSAALTSEHASFIHLSCLLVFALSMHMSLLSCWRNGLLDLQIEEERVSLISFLMQQNCKVKTKSWVKNKNSS